MLDATKSVYENIRDGAQHVLDLIKEFESLPHDSKRHEQLELRIHVLDGWTVDRRIEVAMSHLNCPAGERRIETLFRWREAPRGDVPRNCFTSGLPDARRADEPS